jgi:catechol 2,3-dioxygenase-like lactoylglutathione lyase family enzyme
MPINSFDHFTVRCADLDAAWAFYRDALGLRVEPREVASGLRAAIVSLEDRWLVHLFQATPEQDAIFRRMEPPDAETAKWRTVRMHHIALWATGLSEMRARLQRHGIAYQERLGPEWCRVVVNDPDGIELEINFPAAEAV